MYEEVCKVYILRGIIKDMKIDSKNKWRKVDSVILDTKLDTSIYQDLMKKLNTSSIYRDLRFQNSQIWNLAHDDLDC